MVVVTGTRAEYGLLTSTLRAIQSHPRLALQLVVTGMHLLRRFGHTVRHIERDGWPMGARVRMQGGDDSPTDQAEGLARGVAGIARFLVRSAGETPTLPHDDRRDIVVVLGDRIEAMAGALAAVTTGRLLVHIHGGDVAPGDFDDALRHAITKLAHVHLAATRDAARRIIRMGEDPRRVHVVGAPGLDELRAVLDRQSRAAARRAETANERPTALVVYHAWGRPPAVERQTMLNILVAAAERGLRRLIVFPNTDRGHGGVLTAIEEHTRESAGGDVTVVRSLARGDYLRALIAADVLIGNSSSGIIEAPFAGTPSVNVGGRQAGRKAGGRCIVGVGESLAAIRRGLAAALRMRPRGGGQTPYGDGRTGQRIARLLAALPANMPLAKTITY